MDSASGDPETANSNVELKIAGNNVKQITVIDSVIEHQSLPDNNSSEGSLDRISKIKESQDETRNNNSKTQL